MKQVVDRSGFAAAVATTQFAIRDILSGFLVRYPRVNVVAHSTNRNVDIVG
jgi:hypothetical protein